MFGLIRYHKLIRCGVMITVLALLVISGGDSAAQKSSAKIGAAIVVVPNVVNIKARQVEIYGSGFIPDERVILEVVGVYRGKFYKSDDVCFGAAVANQYGTFQESLGLRYITRFSVKAGPGVYTVRATSDAGIIATAPLVLKGK